MSRICIATLSLLAIAVAAPFAAGEEGAFAFEDAGLDASPPPANGWADIIGGFAEVVDGGATLRTTLQLALLPEMQPGVAYGFIFAADDGAEHFTAVVTVPTPEYIRGGWADDGPSGAVETTGAYIAGPGGSVSIDFPLGQLPGVTMLSAPRGMVLDIKGDALPIGGPVIVLDTAEGDATLAIREPSSAAAPLAEDGAGAAPGVTPAEAPDAAAREAERAVPLAPAAALLALAAVALARRSR